MLRSSRIGLTSTRSSARSKPGVGDASPSPCGPRDSRGLPSPACRRPARSPGRTRRGRTRRARPTVPLPAIASACSITAAMPPRSMSFIVKTRTPEARTISFSRSSRLRMPISTVCSGCTFGENPPMRDSSAGSWPEQRRERHAVDVAAAARGGRVHVAVRVDPDEADPPAAAAHEVRGGRDRPGREAVVAAEHERHAALLERRERTSCRGARRPSRSRGCTSSAGRRRPWSPGSARRDRPRRRPSCRARSAARRARQSGTRTGPCRRRGGCRRDPARRR